MAKSTLIQITIICFFFFLTRRPTEGVFTNNFVVVRPIWTLGDINNGGRNVLWNWMSGLASSSCCEALVKRAPRGRGDAHASLRRCLCHLLLADSSIAEVCKGSHVFHSVLGEGSTACLKAPNLYVSHHFRITELFLNKNFTKDHWWLEWNCHASIHCEPSRKKQEIRVIQLYRHCTIFLRQSQSSTRGCPVGRMASSTSEPFSIPNNSFPISFTLLSIWTLWDIASTNFFWASTFLVEPSGALRN